jgi:PPOX class probable F420-dependent enzyme
MPPDLDLVRRLGGAEHGLVVIAVARPNGTVHTSVVNAGVLDDPDSGQPCIGFVARGDAKKLDFVRTSGRAAVVFRSGWEWVTVEGPARIIGPGDVAADQLATLLRDVFKGAGGTHDDWDEYDRVMASEGRAAVLVEPKRIISN